MDDFSSTYPPEWISQMNQIKNIKITSSSKIGNNAFNGATSLISWELDENVETMGDSSFKGCVSLGKKPDLQIENIVYGLKIYT